MRQTLATLLLILSLTGCQVREASLSEYPPTRRSDQIDEYHGIEVADPYRWLEQNTDETRDWIVAQNDLLENYVSAVPTLDSLHERLLEIRRYGRFGAPVRRGGLYFYTHTEAGANHGELFVQEGLEGEARKVLAFEDVVGDPEHRIGGYSASPDGRHVVWASQAPTGWGWLDLASVADGRPYDERIQGIAGNSAIWTHDNVGFFYLSYGDIEALTAGAEPVSQVRYHRVGTSPSEDELVYERPDQPQMLFAPKLSDDGRWLVVSLNDGSSALNEVVYLDVTKSERTFIPLIDEADAGYTFEGNVGTRFFFQTSLDAPRGRLIAIDIDRPTRKHWTELIPQRDTPLAGVSHIGGRLVVRSTEHARPVVEVWTYEGQFESRLELPTIGLLVGFVDDPESSLTFYRLNSLHDPGTTYRVDLRTGISTVHQRLELAHDPDDYEIKQVFYESTDGARVPMFLAHRKDVPLRSKRPLFMYGYGHGGWVAFPWFQPHLISWLDMGGTYALPGLRGGGEYGREWQEAGTLLNKPNTIDDFIAAAEWLIEHEYTTADQLVANGGSASGVVPAAAVVRRPDLFGAAVIDFPFLDMLRYHQFTAMKGWTRGYGSADDAEEFDVLYGYSPLHNLREGECYPAILTLVGEDDTATVPMHGYKFTAAFQQAQGCDSPGLLKFIEGAGHYSYGTSTEEAARTEAQILGFLVRALGIKS
jgi:prolyl oligopeptidase